MKIIFSILLLILGYQQIDAQDSTKLKSFREIFLPQYILYFDNADITEKGLLKLSAVDKYIKLPVNEKLTILKKITAAWREPLILVQYGTKTELWTWNAETMSTKLLDDWDINSLNLEKTSYIHPQLPWFSYVGIQEGLNNGAINLFATIRIGCFMLNNRWDAAAVFSGGFADTLALSWSIGIMGRKHFLIKDSKLSPSIGGQLMLMSSEGSPKKSFSIVVGISWFVGFGTIDFDLNIGDQVTGLGGCTVAPNMAKRYYR